jgi:hypothetical protein
MATRGPNALGQIFSVEGVAGAVVNIGINPPHIAFVQYPEGFAIFPRQADQLQIIQFVKLHGAPCPGGASPNETPPSKKSFWQYIICHVNTLVL